MTQFQGECLCGACHYTINAEQPDAMYLCHCSRCRKETGSIHASTIFFNRGELEWPLGQDNITHFKLADTRKQRAFCKTCGSPLPWTDQQGHIMLPAGTLNEDSRLKPTAHIFYASRAAWEDQLRDLKRFDELPS